MKFNMWIFGINALFDIIAGIGRATTGQECVIWFIAGGAWLCAFNGEYRIYKGLP